MIDIAFSSNYGKFDYEIVATFPDEVLSPAAKAAAKEGLANTSYRVCGSAADKALGASGESGIKRNEIEFTSENAAKLEAAVLKKLEDLKLLFPVKFKVIGEHEYGEAGSAMLRATTLVDTLLDGGKEEQLRATLAMFGATDKDDRAGLIRIAHKAGLGIQPPKATKSKPTAKADETENTPEVEETE